MSEQTKKDGEEQEERELQGRIIEHGLATLEHLCRLARNPEKFERYRQTARAMRQRLGL